MKFQNKSGNGKQWLHPTLIFVPFAKKGLFYQTTVVAFEDTHLHRLGMEERSTYTCAVCGATFLRKVKPEFYQVKTQTPPAWLVRKLSKKEAK
jgi:hypothetical protein